MPDIRQPLFSAERFRYVCMLFLFLQVIDPQPLGATKWDRALMVALLLCVMMLSWWLSHVLLDALVRTIVKVRS